MNAADAAVTSEVMDVDGTEVVVEFQHTADDNWNVMSVTIGDSVEIARAGEAFASRGEMIEWIAEFARATIQDSAAARQQQDIEQTEF